MFINSICFKGCYLLSALHGLIKLTGFDCESVRVNWISLQLWLLVSSIQWKSNGGYHWVRKTRLLIFEEMFSYPLFRLGEVKWPWLLRIGLILFTSLKKIWSVVKVTGCFEVWGCNLTGLHFAVLISIGTCGLHWFVCNTTVRLEKVSQSSADYRCKWTGFQTRQVFYYVVKILSTFCPCSVDCDCVGVSWNV